MKSIPNLRISLIQTSLFWEDRQQNLSHIEGLIGGLKGKTDIIILPEMFSSGFSMNTASAYDTMEGETMDWLRNMAQSLASVICGSIKVKEKQKFYNRFIWMMPNGDWQKYDKRHLFSFAEEDKYFTKGEEKLLIEYKGWKISPLICYDLRFPVWSKNTLINGAAEYDLLIYTANWPEVRKVAWQSLLLARAIENQSFVAGVNRVGVDGKMITYSGDSAIINPYGAYLSEAQNGHEDIIHAELDYALLTDFRKKFPVLNDADHFTIK